MALFRRQVLRVALLSVLEPADVSGVSARGLLRVGGACLARHQVALALAAGARRILCHARGFGPGLAELQHEAEKGGASFHVVTGAHGLSPLVTAADDVLVMTEGLLPTAGDALRMIASGPMIAIQPAESGIPAGYERIDLNHAFAGLMLAPGRLVDRLMELPSDADPASALLRIALQAGVVQRPIPDEVRLGGRWLLVRSEQEAHEAEDGWMVRHTAGCPRTPGPLLARFLVRQFGSALLHGGNSSLIGTAIAALLAALALAACWFGWATTGFALAGLGWILQRGSAMLEHLKREALAERAPPVWAAMVPDIGFDLLLVAMIVVTLPALPGQLLIAQGFAPVMLVGLLRLLSGTASAQWAAWFGDRFVLCLMLAAFAIGQVIEPGVPLIGVLLLFVGLVLPRDDAAVSRLTSS